MGFNREPAFDQRASGSEGGVDGPARARSGAVVLAGREPPPCRRACLKTRHPMGGRSPRRVGRARPSRTAQRYASGERVRRKPPPKTRNSACFLDPLG